MGYTYKDITLQLVERSITVSGTHRITLKSQNGSLVYLNSKKSIKLDNIPKSMQDNYEQLKRLTA